MKRLSCAIHVDGEIPDGSASIYAESRKGGRWRTTVVDDRRLGEEICHVDTIDCPTDNPLDVLRVALDTYHTYREGISK